MRMTKNMLSVLEKIYKAQHQAGYVHMTTAYALERRELVQIGKIPKQMKTQGGDFPHLWASLTKKGKKFCEEKFG